MKNAFSSCRAPMVTKWQEFETYRRASGRWNDHLYWLMLAKWENLIREALGFLPSNENKAFASNIGLPLCSYSIQVPNTHVEVVWLVDNGNF